MSVIAPAAPDVVGRPSPRVAGLDVLRGVAIALVMLRHAVPALFPGAGVVGVVMFFTLSGFLITGLLTEEFARAGGVRLGDFYRRRVVRLAPALVVLVAGYVLVTVTWDPLGERSAVAETVLVALTWTGNLPLWSASPAMFHLWTLATEEQFYLLWPTVLLLGLRRGRAGWAAAAAAAAALIGCLATLVWLHDAPDLAYALPTSWAVCFVIGGATRLAVGVSAGTVDRRPARPGWRTLAPWVAGAVLALLSVLPVRGSALTYLVVGPVVSAATAATVIAALRFREVSTAPARAFAALGVVSYGAYLWNYPLTLWLR
ncbi:MAG: acyltransferase, partial [Nocardioides sp.]